MTRVYGKTETSPPSRIDRKYKMAKKYSNAAHNIWLYHGVELLCKIRAKSANPFFSWGNRGSLSFLFTHTINQSNKFFHLVYRSHMKYLKQLLWLKSRGFTPRCAFRGYRWWQIMFRGSKFPQNWIVGGLNGPFKQKRPKNLNRLTWKLV